jgi:CRISPR-associated protein Cmr5
MMAQTNGQKMAQAAYKRIVDRKPDREFASFARSFPSLIHSCGLAQAVAFAQAKRAPEKGKDTPGKYLDDLAAVLAAVNHSDAHSDAATADALEAATREAAVPDYIRLSRNALHAAGWLKRYVEAVSPQQD